MQHPAAAISTRDLARVFTPKHAHRSAREPIVALDGVSLEVQPGHLFGLLGRNGAGKTTLIKILTTLLLPSSGEARVHGYDVVRDPGRIRERISVVSGGETTGFGMLTVREQLWMFGRFYGMASRPARQRIDELLDVVGLFDERHRKIGDLSTGMRQKMNLVRGLLPDPEVLFLDEPTVGLDVAAARDIRNAVREWIDARPGRTILLTTHYLNEADELCDRVAIIHRGRIIADDTPAALRRQAGRGSVFLLVTESLNGSIGVEQLPGVRHAAARELDGRTELRLELEDDGAMGTVFAALNEQRRRVLSLQKIEPSLEDAFVEIVGERFGEGEDRADPEDVDGHAP